MLTRRDLPHTGHRVTEDGAVAADDIIQEFGEYGGGGGTLYGGFESKEAAL